MEYKPHFKLLYRTVKKSKDIPSEYKEKVITNLIKDNITNIFIGDGKKYKYLFANGMLYRAYEIYTTSLMAFHLRNRNSIYLLMRAQFENVGKIAYYLKYPNKIKESFNPDKDEGIRLSTFNECLGELYKKDGLPDDLNADYLKDMSNYFSGMAHPFSDGLKMYYGGMAIMTKEPGKPYPFFKPTLHMKAHHASFSDEEKKYYIESILVFYREVLRLLTKIYNLDNDEEIEDYSELHMSWLQKKDTLKEVKKSV